MDDFIAEKFNIKKSHRHDIYMQRTIIGPLIPTRTHVLFIIPAIDSFDKS